jgi:hypothetical protein
MPGMATLTCDRRPKSERWSWRLDRSAGQDGQQAILHSDNIETHPLPGKRITNSLSGPKRCHDVSESICSLPSISVN